MQVNKQTKELDGKVDLVATYGNPEKLAAYLQWIIF
jgi:hypothetical protein